MYGNSQLAAIPPATALAAGIFTGSAGSSDVLLERIGLDVLADVLGKSVLKKKVKITAKKTVWETTLTESTVHQQYLGFPRKLQAVKQEVALGRKDVPYS